MGAADRYERRRAAPGRGWRAARLRDGIGIVAVFAAALCVAAPGEAKKGGDGGNGADSNRPIRTLEKDHFSFVGLDRRSLSVCHAMSRAIVRETERYCSVPETFPQRILVKLVPGEAADFAGNHRVSVERGGFVSLELRWTRELDREEALFALADAFLRRWVYFRHGQRLAERAQPLWAVSAIGSGAYLALRPEVRQVFHRQVNREAPPDLGEWLDRRVPETADARAMRVGYWVKRAFRAKREGARDLVGELLRTALAGRDAMAFARESLDWGESSPEAWWAEIYPGITRPVMRRYATMSESRRRLRGLASFDFRLEKNAQQKAPDAARGPGKGAASEGAAASDGGRDAENDGGAPADASAERGERPDLRSLWTHRENERMREVLRARLRLIVARLNTINPVYHNASQTLGVLYRSVLNGDRQHKFIRALGGYLSDFERAEGLHDRIEQALDARENG